LLKDSLLGQPECDPCAEARLDSAPLYAALDGRPLIHGWAVTLGDDEEGT